MSRVLPPLAICGGNILVLLSRNASQFCCRIVSHLGAHHEIPFCNLALAVPCCAAYLNAMAPARAHPCANYTPSLPSSEPGLVSTLCSPSKTQCSSITFRKRWCTSFCVACARKSGNSQGFRIPASIATSCAIRASACVFSRSGSSSANDAASGMWSWGKGGEEVGSERARCPG